MASTSTIAQTPAPTRELNLGIKLLKDRKFDEAIRVLRKVTGSDKTDAEGWYYLGVAYVYSEDFKKALRSQFADAHTGLAYALCLGESFRI